MLRQVDKSVTVIKRIGKFDWCAVIEKLKQWRNLRKRQNVLSLQQECSRPTKDTGASVLGKKFFFRRSPKKKVIKKIFASARVTYVAGAFNVHAYAADLAVLVTGADMLWIRGMAQKAINIAAN